MAAGAGERLFGRRGRLIIQFPVKTPGDFQHVTSDVLEINSSPDADSPGNRIQFSITKTLEKDPNTSTITVTNLAPEHRAALQQKGVKVTLEGGYKATGIFRIFFGDMRTCDHVRNGADWESVMRLGDGERSIQFARLAESFAPGTGAGDVVRRLGQAMGLALGNVPDVILNIQQNYDQGYSVSGPCSRSLDRILKGLGYTWSVQDGALQVLLPNGTIGGEVPVISPTTGLIDSPEMGTAEKKGKPALVKFKSLLFAARPGSRVKLESERYNGFVRVKKVNMEGDTRGGNWYTTCEGVNVGQQS